MRVCEVITGLIFEPCWLKSPDLTNEIAPMLLITKKNGEKGRKITCRIEKRLHRLRERQGRGTPPLCSTSPMSNPSISQTASRFSWLPSPPPLKSHSLVNILSFSAGQGGWAVGGEPQIQPHQFRSVALILSPRNKLGDLWGLHLKYCKIKEI